MEIAMDSGAEDVKSDSGVYEIFSDPDVLDDIRSAIEAKGITLATAEITMIPQTTVKLETESDANAMLKMLDLLEDADDVQKVYSNFDIDEDLLAKVAG